jgi:hypothetical protein
MINTNRIPGEGCKACEEWEKTAAEWENTVNEWEHTLGLLAMVMAKAVGISTNVANDDIKNTAMASALLAQTLANIGQGKALLKHLDTLPSNPRVAVIAMKVRETMEARED